MAAQRGGRRERKDRSSRERRAVLVAWSLVVGLAAPGRFSLMSSRLSRRAALAVACAVPVIAIGAFAAAANAGQSGSSVGVDIQFSITMPPGQQVAIAFTGGIEDISQQSVAALPGGSLRVVTTSQTGWTLEPSGSGTVGATIFLFGYGVSGIPIDGIATVPAGAKLTASVNDGSSQTITNGDFSLAIPSTAIGAPHGPTLSASPGAVKAGRRVTVSGTVAGGCARGDAVTLISKAFASTYRFAGLPAVYANVQAKGRFAVTTRVPASRKPGRYTITGRCGGGNLGVVARLRVIKP